MFDNYSNCKAIVRIDDEIEKKITDIADLQSDPALVAFKFTIRDLHASQPVGDLFKFKDTYFKCVHIQGTILRRTEISLTVFDGSGGIIDVYFQLPEVTTAIQLPPKLNEVPRFKQPRLKISEALLCDLFDNNEHDFKVDNSDDESDNETEDEVNLKHLLERIQWLENKKNSMKVKNFDEFSKLERGNLVEITGNLHTCCTSNQSKRMIFSSRIQKQDSADAEIREEFFNSYLTDQFYTIKKK